MLKIELFLIKHLQQIVFDMKQHAATKKKQCKWSDTDRESIRLIRIRLICVEFTYVTCVNNDRMKLNSSMMRYFGAYAYTHVLFRNIISKYQKVVCYNICNNFYPMNSGFHGRIQHN